MVRDNASQLVGRTISKREWAAARQHRLFPGIGEPLEAAFLTTHRKRVKDKTIIEFIEWLKADDFLQSMSFGQKVVRYFNHRFVAIESVKRTESILRITQSYYRRFITAAEAEMNILGDSEEDADDLSSGFDDDIPGLANNDYSDDDSDSDSDDEEDNDDQFSTSEEAGENYEHPSGALEGSTCK